MDTDINYIIQMSLNGDKNYQEILLETLKPMIFKNIYTYYSPMNPITEDLEQEGYIIILESLKNFDQKRNVHFLHYIKIKLFYFYKNYYRKIKRDSTNISIVENMTFDQFDRIQSTIEKEIITELMNNIKKLSLKEQQILYLNFYMQMDMQEISNYLSIPYRTCIWRKYSAIKKLKKLMKIRG